MATQTQSQSQQLQALIDLIATQKAIIAQYLVILDPATIAAATSTSTTSSTNDTTTPNPLVVLRDSATLLKAHTTKLGLLLLNKPFTPSAVTKVLRDYTTTCLPAMMSAVQLCTPETWGSLLRSQVCTRVRNVMREMHLSLDEVRMITEQELASSSKAKTKKSHGAKSATAASAPGRDALTSTAVVWEACDGLIELETLGIAGLAVKRAEEWRDMIRDAVEELKEWAEEGEDDEDDDDEDDKFVGSDDEDDHDSMEDIFGAANALPKDRQDLKDRLTTAQDRLKKIQMLYAALSKRRLKPFSTTAASPANVKTLDVVLGTLKDLPETVDELASAFYDLDVEQVDALVAKLVADAEGAAQTARLDWQSKEDEFTIWSAKWADAVKL